MTAAARSDQLHGDASTYTRLTILLFVLSEYGTDRTGIPLIAKCVRLACRSQLGAQQCGLVAWQPLAAGQCAHSACAGAAAVGRRASRRVARVPSARVARAGRAAYRATQLRRARESLPQEGISTLELISGITRRLPCRSLSFLNLLVYCTACTPTPCD